MISEAKVRIHHFAREKARGEKITMLTAYDALTARIFEAAGVDALLVGDSLGNVVLGYDSTLPVELSDMIRATEAVSRVTNHPLVVADLSFGSYEAGPVQAFESAAALMKAGAQAVKLEGGVARAHLISALVDGGIPVMAHIGYTPQAEHALGGPRLQGRGDTADCLLQDALAVEEAGAFAVVLEMVPASLAARISKRLTIPTIGIGAGPDCDGQVLVWSDMAGMTSWSPKFAKRFAELGEGLKNAAKDYVDEVRAGSFPSAEHSRES